MPEGELTLPPLLERVRRLADIVPVDYEVPGCPPEPHTIDAALTAMMSDAPPPKGSVLGSGPSSVCKQCARPRGEHSIGTAHRTHLYAANTTDCLLEQGLMCMGPATREGCGSLCPQVNMPCTGCYGPPDGILDQGAKMIGALGSVMDIGNYRGMSEDELRRRSAQFAASVVDQAGTWYKYSLASSILGGKRGQNNPD